MKLRKKSETAAYLKRGDVVQVTAVHPTDGSCKFWNESTESAGYLYPDEFYVVPAPPVTESTPGDFDSVTELESIEPATESIPEVDDSVTELESIEPVTESIPEPVDSVTELGAVEPVTESIPGNFDSVTRLGVSTYSPKGTARSGELKYFKFSYRCGKKVKHIHIPGGSIASPIAADRAAEVMELSAAGIPAVEIVATIKSWRRDRSLK